MKQHQAPISASELRSSTLLFSLLSLVTGIPLIWLVPEGFLSPVNLTLITTSGLFWGCLTLLAFRYFWDVYYQYIYPGWFRKLGLSNFLLYAFITWVMLLAITGPGKIPILVFIFLGGSEGILEHLLGIQLLGILEKVPWLQGLRPLPVLLFSFVEYLFYWSIVLWFAIGVEALI